MRHLLNWQVGYCNSADKRPAEYFAAAVPGAVQLDYARQYNLPDYNRELNFKEYKWIEDKFWVYTSEFDASGADKSSFLYLYVGGIDYRYEIYANGEKVCDYEGMYKRQRIPLTNLSGGKIALEIIVYPAPKSTLPGVHKDTRDEANQCCKPAVSYGWDFHPRLVPLGIWEEIYIEELPRESALDPEISYTLSDDLKTVHLKLLANNLPDTHWKIADPDGKVIFEGDGEEIKTDIPSVRLWWCNGYGAQPLYNITAAADGCDTVSRKIGFKKIELVKAEGSWEERLNYPMSRNTPPITVRLNNTVIFAKGSNWVCPEIFYGTLTYERYREQLELVKRANFNFLRCWGGAIINKESFFELCDELGIMIWQEFPLACNCYEGTEHYVSVLESEATAIIDRIKQHVCLMFWCGGNELFNNWSLMTEQDKPIRLMHTLTFLKTPEIPFLPTSPVMGMAHGPYAFNLNDGREVIEVLAESRNTAYTEFGGGGFSTTETLKMIADIKNPSEINKDNEIAAVHGEYWVRQQFERYFGKIESIESLIECSQYQQSVGQQFIFEEARRQKPYCSIVSNWCFNEPWPNIGNNSIISYPSNLKPAYYAVANACRSVLASARYRKLVNIAGETLDFDLFLLNDSLEKLPDGTVKVFIQVGEGERVNVLNWEYKDVPICTNAEGPTVRYKLPFVNGADTLSIILECGEYSSKYTLLYRLPKAPANAPKKMNAILDENA